MKINRNNYEEYFILYLDNELESEDRRQVEAFAQANPDLKAELNVLQQSKLAPDNDIAFTDKGSLMRFDSSSISQANYEEWLVSYIDDELTEKERKDVEGFVAGNPAIQKELSLLQQTKLQPEAIVFPAKESLYRKEEKAKVIAIRWWRIAAAAVLLIGISTTAIVLLNNRSKNGKEEIADRKKKEKPVINPTTDKQPQTTNVAAEEPVVNNPLQKNKPSLKENKNRTNPKEENKIAIREKNEQSENIKHKEQVIVQNKKEIKPNNELPKPENNPYVTGNPDHKDVIADANVPPKEILTISDKKTDIGLVTASKVETSDPIEQSSGNKGLRGFFRKVTRTFEKKTNIKATDDDDRLLIAGLAIKM